METFDQQEFERDRATIGKGFWPKLRRFAARVPFAEEAAAAWYCARDPATPSYVRAILVGALAYFVIPTDVIPDIIAGIGFTDDATVLVAAVQTVRKHIQPGHREKARAALARLADVDDQGEPVTSGSSAS